MYIAQQRHIASPHVPLPVCCLTEWGLQGRQGDVARARARVCVCVCVCVNTLFARVYVVFVYGL